MSDKGMKPVNYWEGHYLYLQCPAVEHHPFKLLNEWHPFTISSAPDEPVLEVRVIWRAISPATSRDRA